MSSTPIRVPPQIGYELWAQSWDDDPSPIVALEERTAKPLLGDLQGKRFVEASCGTGRWLAHACERGARGAGFDFSQAMLRAAAHKSGLLGRIAIADTRRLPLANASADVVLCALSLGHMPPVSAVMEELCRLVEPRGRLVVTDFHPEATREGWKRTFRKNGQLYEIENHDYSIEGLKAQAKKAGLKLKTLEEPCFSEPEREIFRRCGKSEIFDSVRTIPAVLVTVWEKHRGAT